MPVLPDGTYPQMAERIGTAEQLMVRPNPPRGRGVFQRVYLAPGRLPKWIRDKLGPEGFARAADVYHALGREARRWPNERFVVLCLDVKNKVRAAVEISQGTLDASLVHPREVFMAAIGAGAATVMLVHNHPSGDPEPSVEDIALTKRLMEAATLLGIPILDHLIIGDRGFVSLAERGHI